jgi:hypothetical protein
VSSNDQDYVILNTLEEKSELAKLVEYAWRRQNSIPKSVNPSFQENFSGQYSSVAQVDDDTWILDGGHGGINTWQSYVPEKKTIILLGGGFEINTVEAPLLYKEDLISTVTRIMNETMEMKFYVDDNKIIVVEDGKRKPPDEDPYFFKSGPHPGITVPKDPTLASTSMYDKQQVAIYYEEVWALAVKFNKGAKSDHILRAHHWGSGYQLDTIWKIHLVDLEEHLKRFNEDAEKKNYTKNL